MATRFRLNFEQIFGTSAQVLAGGTLTFAISGGAPDQLQTIYQDPALSVTKLNPVVLDSAGKHGDIWLDDPSRYRVILKDAAGIPIPGGDVDPIDGGPNDARIVNVKSFGAKGDGVTNDSAAIQAALDACSAVFIPPGTYLCNVSVNCRVKVMGASSVSSILKPFNTALAAVTLVNATGDWSMSYLFEALGFSGTGRVGIGVAFAKTDPALYAAGDEFVGRATFNNCYFSELDKGIQRTFGNIGLYLNRTSFLHCNYGTYNLNAKFGGTMHAGNFYCHGGETSGCSCGHYFHNGTTDGFGAVEFDGHVFELNTIGLYGYTNSPGMQAAFAFRSYWSEAQGVLWTRGARVVPRGLLAKLATEFAATVTLDTWIGSAKGTAAFDAHAFIFDGVGANASFRDGGVFSDVFLKATDATVISENDHFESASGFGGLPCVVADPSHSRILVSNFSCNEGGANVVGMMTDGLCTQASPAFGSQGASGRANMIPFRTVISDLNNIVGVNNGCNTVAAGACDMVGAKTLTAGSSVGDGSLYANAAIYSDTLTDSQFCKLTGSDLALSVGWWVWSCDIRSASNARFLVTDLGANLLASVTPPSDGNWHCYGGVGFLASGTPGVGLWVGGFAAVASAVNFALRNYQLKKFATRFEAQDFLRSRVYAT